VLTLGLCYVNRNLTDGWVPAALVRRWLSEGSTREAADEAEARLLRVCLLVPSDREGIAGYQIHADYVRHQPTRAQTLRKRTDKSRQKAEAGRLGGEASGEARRKQARSKREAPAKHDGSTDEAPVPDPDPQKEQSTDAFASASPRLVESAKATHNQLCAAYQGFLQVTTERGADLKEAFKVHLAQLHLSPESSEALRKAMDAVEHVDRLRSAALGRGRGFVAVGDVARVS
jgi:hypothetical protein